MDSGRCRRDPCGRPVHGRRFTNSVMGSRRANGATTRVAPTSATFGGSRETLWQWNPAPCFFEARNFEARLVGRNETAPALKPRAFLVLICPHRADQSPLAMKPRQREPRCFQRHRGSGFVSAIVGMFSILSGPYRRETISSIIITP